MQFNSTEFLVFFPIVLIIYFTIPKKFRIYWLLLSSYFFYMCWNAKYALLIATSTLVTFFGGLIIQRLVEKKRNRIYIRVILVFCIVFNLLILFVFKYGNFCVDTFDSLMNLFGVNTIHRRFDILLPVGISFYTFQALGYLIDVYRGDIQAEKNIIRYSLFVSFFPQLVAGPIERSKNLLSQIKNIHNINLFNAKRITSGSILMVWGLYIKMVIADRLSVLTDTVFDNYRMFGSTELVLAVLFFSLQIYCDFGSYSLIAIGSSKIMGFDLMENFISPYFATSIRDFWSRWHISLSTWFRDYLYIPLGGNRKGRVRKFINTFLVFLVSGLWHGANWSFVLWGGIHGIYLIIGDILKPYKVKMINRFRIKTDCFSWNLLKRLITFSLVAFAWIFFRSNTVIDAFRFIKRIFIRPTPWRLLNGAIYNLGLDSTELLILSISLLVLFIFDFIRYKHNELIDVFLFKQNLWFEWFIIIGLIMSIFIFGEYGPAFDAKLFIYFQF